MHELGLIEELVKIAEGELERAGVDAPVTRVVLRVGRLSGASPEALETAFDVVAPQTKLRGAVLEIHEPRPLCRCAACGLEQEVDGFLLACPSCASPVITIEGGQDLMIESLDVED